MSFVEVVASSSSSTSRSPPFPLPRASSSFSPSAKTLFSSLCLSVFLSLFSLFGLVPEGATQLGRSLIVTKLLKGRGGQPRHYREMRVVTEFILVHPRARVPRPVLPFLMLRLVRRHTWTLPSARTLLLERTRFYLSLSPVNGPCRAPRRVSEISLSLSLCFSSHISLTPQFLSLPLVPSSLSVNLPCDLLSLFLFS